MYTRRGRQGSREDVEGGHLAKGGSGPFSCARCKHLSPKGDEYHCSSEFFQRFTGGSLLKDGNGKPLDDPSRACSDWFQEQKK